jgi:hypothetical protein
MERFAFDEQIAPMAEKELLYDVIKALLESTERVNSPRGSGATVVPKGGGGAQPG